MGSFGIRPVDMLIVLGACAVGFGAIALSDVTSIAEPAAAKTIAPGAGRATEPTVARTAATASGFSVDGNVTLASLIAIGDAHLVKLADMLKVLAGRPEVVAGDWAAMKMPLAEVGRRSVPAAHWFALPTGEYWTQQEDHMEANLKQRAYFARLLAGHTVIGDLVVSKSTGNNVAIVAVPVFNGKQVVGVLGSSVYLGALSTQIRKEMALPANVIFYSFDAKPQLALEWDPGLIFAEPKQLGAEIDQAFQAMLSQEKGAIEYSFRGKTRTVLFRKSPVTNWRYALGLVHTETASRP